MPAPERLLLDRALDLRQRTLAVAMVQMDKSCVTWYYPDICVSPISLWLYSIGPWFFGLMFLFMLVCAFYAAVTTVHGE
jgi:hypothetical protein